MVNTIELCGTLGEILFSYEVAGKQFYSSTISVPRLSGAVDDLAVTAPAAEFDGALLGADRCAKISGQLRSYNKYEDGKSKLDIRIFATEVTFLPDCFFSGLNEVLLEGFICKPPVYRKTPFGREICDMMLAVNRNFGKSDYIPAIAWGDNAAICAVCKPGDQITVAGRMQSRAYDKALPTGIIKKTAHELSIAKIMSQRHR